MRMKIFLMNFLKTSKWFSKVYRLLGSFTIKLIGLMVKTDDRLILFNSFGGKKYDDSPRALFEHMRTDSRFQTYQFIWAFHDPTKFVVPGAKTIRVDSIRYFITAQKARVWISNSGIERGLSFKKKDTIYFNTWHGTPLKFMGSDAGGKPRDDLYYSWDFQNVQSEYEAKIFSRVFQKPYKAMMVVGYPRNDELTRSDEHIQKAYKEKLHININKTVILYAPTFREYERDSLRNCILKPPIDFDKWCKELGEDYVILVRCHYEVVKLFSEGIDGVAVRDVSDYPVLNDLMIASDILITDYSSIMFDYSILNRPIFLYTYDYDIYKEKRGLYFDVRAELPGGSVSEDELLALIKNSPLEQVIFQVATFRSRYVTAFGHSTKRTLDKLWTLLIDI